MGGNLSRHFGYVPGIAHVEAVEERERAPGVRSGVGLVDAVSFPVEASQIEGYTGELSTMLQLKGSK